MRQYGETARPREEVRARTANHAQHVPRARPDALLDAQQDVLRLLDEA
jgi:hypothetical protein